ncbi:hypothetical protein ETB97_008512 [Aspergillus alliaceus]|uniref:2EXR domain-containing protein n=1 Tax=Petromyces alliaceus TaxID=209559 RepID=A0A5N7CHT6_PETAA|nr:hypothetical protein BDV23DRAFT_180201 [Aspergillus alliaceus]KAF5864106.1 hypothetical protein ETB97_008512 [Aspergillus burnettii]
MASAQTNSSTFTCFPCLPPELRQQIWREALPDNFSPALYPYKKGCWCPRQIPRSDPRWHELSHIDFEFRNDLLDHVQVKVQLTFVNREARNVALSWACKQPDIQMRFLEERQCQVFALPFKQERDALYVPLDKVHGFLVEPIDRSFEPDLLDQGCEVLPHVDRVAVPEALLQIDPSAIPDMFLHYYWLEELIIIVGEQPEWEDDDVQVHRRWEFEDIQGKVLCWDGEHGRFEWRGENGIGDEAISRQLQDVGKQLYEPLTSNHTSKFEIRAAVAIRR